MKLFAIVVGGEHPRAHVEVHDIRFVIAARIEDCYEPLRQQWWGSPDSLHIDCWAELNHLDGYDVTIADTPQVRDHRLYYVNLGGYDRNQFAELHHNVFVVADTAKTAKAKAVALGPKWRDLHRDDFYEAEQVVTLDNLAQARGAHIWLTPNANGTPFTFTCDYKPIALKSA